MKSVLWEPPRRGQVSVLTGRERSLRPTYMNHQVRMKSFFRLFFPKTTKFIFQNRYDYTVDSMRARNLVTQSYTESLPASQKSYLYLWGKNESLKPGQVARRWLPSTFRRFTTTPLRIQIYRGYHMASLAERMN